MTTTSKKIAHAITEQGKELICVLTRYPRFIHAEVMTHRVFSRNASSSRAIPVKRMIADIRRDPAMPIHWGQNQAGMQARSELPEWKKKMMRGLWLTGMWIMTTIASIADKVGCHKQVVNRLIEPWAHINVLISSTEWDNFFELRNHPDAQPEIRALAIAIELSIKSGPPPKLLKTGEWQTPFVDEESDPELFKEGMLTQRIACSVARCARTSYLTHDQKKPTIKGDLDLYAKLVVAKPMHASPAEHQATPDEYIGRPFGSDGTQGGQWMRWHLHGNFVGFCQHRKHLEFGLT